MKPTVKNLQSSVNSAFQGCGIGDNRESSDHQLAGQASLHSIDMLNKSSAEQEYRAD